jgi:peptidoglycan-N-acetylglucosamine deacetylase
MTIELQRKINIVRCFIIRKLQPKVMFKKDQAYLTIFHDYERQYHKKSVIGYSDKGVEKILDIEKKYNIKATYNIVGKLINDVPIIISRILSDGHEIASHSNKHSIMTKLSKREINFDIEQTKSIFQSQGIKLNGFRSPQSRWSFKQMSILLSHGFKWSAENDYAKFPYIIAKNKDSHLVRMPIAMDDWGYESSNQSPSIMLQNINRCVDKISKEKCYGAIGFHPWVQGKADERLSVFEELIANLSHRNDLKIITFSEALSTYSKFFV